MILFCCNPEEAWHTQLGLESEHARQEFELEQDLARARELDWEEPQEVEVEVHPIHLVPKWAQQR